MFKHFRDWRVKASTVCFVVAIVGIAMMFQGCAPDGIVKRECRHVALSAGMAAVEQLLPRTGNSSS